MRIVHFSDFHLDFSYRDDIIRSIVEPLVECIRDVNSEQQIDLLLFTGDLINKGGESYGGIEAAFKDFDAIFIRPLLECVGLNNDRFYFVPGNHDIDRKTVNKIVETGLKNSLLTESDINELMIKPQGIERILPYKNFEAEFYKSTNNNIITKFQSSFIIDLNGDRIGISSFNSAWRCYNSEADKNQILIGEKQILDSLAFIKDCNIKIALSHHHYDWLSIFDSEIISSYLVNNYNIYFCGHNHSTKSYFYQDPDGQLFIFSASGMLSPNIKSSSKKNEIGFSIIDYDLLEESIKVRFKKAEYQKKVFVDNTSLGKNGLWINKIPVGEEVSKLIEEKHLLEQIKNEIIPSLNIHLLTYGTETNAPKSIDEIFIMPNIVIKDEYNIEKESTYISTISELIESEKNFVIFGTKESGKTILLDRIIFETINNSKTYHTIPAYINFKNDWNEVITEIKAFWGRSSAESKRLICEHKILLLVDDISFEEEDYYKIRALSKFLDDFPFVRLIGTYRQLYEDNFPSNLELVNQIAFDKLTLKQFKAKQIKLLIQKWFPQIDKYETPKKLETLTNAFLALNLPRTPFAVSMFLWIIEKQESFKPINNSILIENFIEKLLNKHGSKEALRERFGYDNKIWILAEISYRMLLKDNQDYSIKFSEFVSIVETYLKLKRFEDFETQNIVQMLLQSGIFLKENGDVRFRFTCFFEFFLVKRMESNPEFLDYILDENRYLKFINEIDYFTGLNRGNSMIVQTVFARLESLYSGLDLLIEEKIKNIPLKSVDDFFTQKDENGDTKQSIINQLDENEVRKFLPKRKPTEEDLEVVEDRKLDMSNDEKGINKKEQGNKYQEFGKLLILSMRVLKNSEEIQVEDLKFNCYCSVLKKSISYAILTKALLENILHNKESISSIKINEMDRINTYLPLLHQILIFDNLGTLKLSAVIRDKIISDNNNDVSDFEKFLSIFIYADIRGRDSEKFISELIRRTKTPFIIDNIFFKLITYFFYRSKDSQSDDKYLNMIGDLFIHKKGYSKYRRGGIIKKYRSQKFKLKKDNQG